MYDLLYPEKPVEAEIKRNLFNWTSIIPPYILMLCYGGGFDHWLIHLVNFSWRVKFSLSNETRCAYTVRFLNSKDPKLFIRGPIYPQAENRLKISANWHMVVQYKTQGRSAGQSGRAAH